MTGCRGRLTAHRERASRVRRRLARWKSLICHFRLVPYQFSRRDFRFGLTSGGLPKPAKGDYALHSSRTPVNAVPRGLKPAPRTHVGQKRNWR